MEFIIKNTARGAYIPRAALDIAGFHGGGAAEYHPMSGTVVVLKKKMTAMELVTAASELQTLASGLLAHIALRCGFCEGCDENCRYLDDDFGYVRIPDELREQAGIPADAKLDAIADEETAAVIITEANYKHDLRDVPSSVLEMFENLGVCLESLETMLKEDGVVYGGD